MRLKDSIVDTTHVNARFSDSVSRLAATDLTAGLRMVLRKGNVFNTNKSKLKEIAICFLKTHTHTKRRVGALV